jgi:GNAT superfamily N-acetyltransferase
VAPALLARAGGDRGLLIREARTEDASAVAGLLGQLGYPVAAPALTARFERLRAAGDRLFVAEAAGRVVGLANLHVSPSLEYDAPAAKLGALVVDHQHRGRGIGRALVEAAEAEARALGCVLLFLTTSERRAGAHAFYERLGLEHTGRRYGKRLD